MTRWLDDDEQRAWRAYRQLVLLVDSTLARELLRDSGLSMPDYMVLSTLSEATGHRRRLTELATRIQWSPSRLSHHVTRMEQRGLVTRADCTEDLRAAYVVLTEAGWTALTNAAPGHVASVRRNLIDLLSPAELETIAIVGERIASHFDGGCPAQPIPAHPTQSQPIPPQPTQSQPIQSANRKPVSRS